MDRANIPGFYFGTHIHRQRMTTVYSDVGVVDPEKGKYFRILPNHVAPAGARYSREGVRRGREGARVSGFCCLLSF